MPRHTVPPPTKEIFIPCTKATDLTVVGDHPVGKIDATGEVAYVELKVPHDFHSIISLQLIFIALATLTPMYFNVDTDYAAEGQAYNVHSEGPTVESINTTLNRITAFNLAGYVDAGPLAAGDYLGAYLTYNGNTNLGLLGLRLRYT